MFIFTKDTNISEALEQDEKVVEVFERLKLQCVECPAQVKETLYDTARYHNIELEKILDELNKLALEKIK